MRLTVGTFNLNNLFDRFNYAVELDRLPAADRTVLTSVEIQPAGPGEPPNRQRTFKGKLVQGKPLAARMQIAERIRRMDLDVLCVQEVEDIDALRRFNGASHADGGLGGLYRWVALVEGNDPRLIDVAVLSKLPLGGVTTWQHTRHPDAAGEPVFGRDLLEADVLDPAFERVVLKVFVTHLKSQLVLDRRNEERETAANDLKRRRQAEMAARIVAKRTSSQTPFVVCGDLNDSPGSWPLAPLADNPELQLVDALEHVRETRAFEDDPAPPSPRWTHRFRDSSRKRTHFELFDQIWASPALAGRIGQAAIERRQLKGGDGSDHDPAWVELDLPGRASGDGR